MRLFLSSYGIGNQPQKLVELIGNTSPKVALVTNAADHHDEAGILERVERDRVMFKDLGMNLERLDLRDYFNNQQDLEQKLRTYDLIWVRGGNAFILRRAIAQSSFDTIITKLLHEDALVYGGYSAGACILSPTLRGVDLCDDPNIIPEGYNPEIIWDGLGLVDFSIAPHYKSEHPEAELIDRVVEYFEHQHMPYKALHDGQAVVINHGQETVLS